MSRYFIGIDPGKFGGMAKIDGNIVVAFTTIPPSPPRCWEILHNWCFDSCNPGQCVVCLEKVGGYVGGVGQPGSAMFNFGRNYGNLEAFIIAAGMIEGKNFHYVRPQDWQKHFGIVPRRKTKGKVKGETQSQWKGRLKCEAEKRFPKLKLTLSTCDALLIALFCKEVYS